MKATLSGKGVLLYLAGFFAVVIAVNVFFIVQAVTTFRGEDEEDSYTQGLEYNHTLERAAAQKALGWRAAIGAAREESRGAHVVVTVTSKGGTPLSHLALKGELRRPTDAARDRALSFREVGPGEYASDARDVAPGIWDVIVETRTDVPFEANRRVWIP